MTDKTQTKAVSNAPLQMGEFAEKYNRGHKIIDFVGHKRFSSEFLLQLLLSVSYVILFLVHSLTFSSPAVPHLNSATAVKSISLNLLILFRLKQQRTESLLHMLRILWVTAAQL